MSHTPTRSTPELSPNTIRWLARHNQMMHQRVPWWRRLLRWFDRKPYWPTRPNGW